MPTESQTSRYIWELEGLLAVYYCNDLILQMKKLMLRGIKQISQDQNTSWGKYRTRTQLSCFPIKTLDFSGFLTLHTQVNHPCARYRLNVQMTLWPRQASFQRSSCPCDWVREWSVHAVNQPGQVRLRFPTWASTSIHWARSTHWP